MVISARRIRALVSGLLVMAVAAAMVVAASRADGRPASQSDTNDGGAWLLDRRAGGVGHVNRSSREVSGAVRAATPATEFDVHQAPGRVLVHDISARLLTMVDDRLYALSATVPLGVDVRVDLHRDRLVLHQRHPFRVWDTTFADLAATVSESLEDLPATLEADGAGEVVVTRSGTVIAVDDSGTVRWLPAEGEPVTAEVSLPGDLLEVTAVGEAAVIEGDDGVAVVDPTQPEAVEFSPDGAKVWQQPGPGHDAVVGVDADGVVRAWDLANGQSQELVDLDSEEPTNSIVHGGCVFALGHRPPVMARVCGDETDLVEIPNHPGGELRLRLVNGWVWVNAIDHGVSWVMDANGELLEASDIGDALEEEGGDEDDGGATSGEATRRETNNDADVVGNADDVQQLDTNEPPLANPDEATSRADQPAVVDVLANDTDANGDVLLVDEVAGESPDAVAEVTGDGRFVQVIPAAGHTGSVTFDYTVSDGRGGTDTATVTVEFVSHDAPNRPPAAVTDFVGGTPGRTVSLNLLANDEDPDGDGISLTGLSGEGIGQPVWEPNGDVTLTPDQQSEGIVEATYTIEDAHGEQAEGRLRVRIRLVEDDNQPPDARHDWAITSVDTAVTFNVLDNDRDPNGDRLTVGSGELEPVATPPEATGAKAPRLVVSPRGALLFEGTVPGTYLYLYTVSDGGATDAALVRVEVREPSANEPPIAVRDTVVVPSGGSRVVPVLRNDADPDGDVLGIVDFTGGTGIDVEPVPDVGFRVRVGPEMVGEGSFRYTVSDGHETASAPVRVVIADPSQDQRPVPVADVVEGRAGQPVTVPVLRNDHDPEGGSLEVVHVGQADGAVAQVGSAGQQVMVTLDADASGGVTVPYEVADEAGNRASSTVTVQLVPPGSDNRVPVAEPDTWVTAHDTPAMIDVIANDVDPDGDPIQVDSIRTQPGHGSATVTDEGLVRYEPDGDFAGTDRVQYWLVDAQGDRVFGDVLIGVMQDFDENRPPVVIDDVVHVVAGDPASAADVLGNDTDPDGDALTVVDVTDTTAGTVSIAADGAALAYTPPDQIESDTIEEAVVYTVDDGAGHAVSGTARIIVDQARTPEPPIAQDDVAGPVAGDQTVAVDVRANDRDPDGDKRQLRVSTDAEDVVVRGGRLRVPVEDVSRTVVYTVTDADGLTASASATVTVRPNRPPKVKTFEAEVPFGEPIELSLTGQATDPDGDPLEYLYNSDARGGRVRVGDDPSTFEVVFEPNAEHVGPAGFTYTVQDDAGHVVQGAVNLTVLPPANEPPAVPDRTIDAEVGRSTPLDLPGLVVDPDADDVHTFEVGAANGPMTLSRRGTRVTITPDVTSTGETATFTVTATDPRNESATGTITVRMTPSTLPPPEANDDAAKTTQGVGVTVPVLSNDVGSGLEVVAVESGNTGSAEIVPGGVRYVPDSEFFGTATFTYRIQDEQRTTARSDTATVRVDIVGFPDTPAAPQATESSREVSLVWNAPAANGAPVDRYEVRHDQSNEVRAIDATSMVWGQLTNGTTYRFRVRAHNEAGWSEWSDPSEPRTPDEVPGRPGAPQVQWDNQRLHVSWKVPPNDGTPINVYELQIGGDASNVIEVAAQPNPSHTWEGLTNGSNYQFRVRARNDKDFGDWSLWSSPEHPNTIPDAPDRPTVSNGPNSLDVTWVPPYDGGDTISEYRVQMWDDNDQVVARRTVSGAASSSTQFAGLENGVTYRFRVKAVNRATPTVKASRGWSELSAPAKACGVPTAPRTIEAERGDQQATVSWQPPADDRGCDITGYQVFTEGSSSPVNVGATTTTTVVKPLTNGQSYRFRVRATNTEYSDQGPGAFSAWSNVVTPAGPPGPVQNLQAAQTSNGGEARVTWDPPADDNGAPVQGYHIRHNNGGWSSWDSTARTYAGLAPGTHTFDVMATNDAGNSEISSTSVWIQDRPTAVPNVWVAATSTSAIRWEWSIGSQSGRPIEDFEIDRSSGSHVRSSNTRYTWSGLPEDARRGIRVRACNQYGCGSWSGWSYGRTDKSPPEAWARRGRVANDPDCSGTCYRARVTMRNFQPNTEYWYHCSGASNWTRGTPYDGLVVTNGSGDWGAADFWCWAAPGVTQTIKIAPHDSTNATVTIKYSP